MALVGSIQTMTTELERIVCEAPQGILIILDGNNFLFAQSPLYGDYREEGFPGESHQQALLSAVMEALRPRSDLLVDLWFDHPVHSVVQVTSQIRLIQSGGRGKNRADRGILAFVQARRENNPDAPYWLVTKDKKLAKRGRCRRLPKPQ